MANVPPSASLALHLRFQDALRQIGAHPGDGVAHVGDRPIDRRADIEFDEDQYIAFGNACLLVMNVADAGNRSFHFLRDLRLHFLRRGAGLGNIDVDCRKGDIRIQVDRQANKRDGAQEKQHHEQHNRGYRVADRPGGNVFHDVPAHHDRFHGLSLLQERTGGRDDLVLGIDAFGNGHPAWHHAGHAHRAALHLALRIDDEYVAALVVVEHRGLRQHRALGVADRHLRARKGARP